VASGQEILLDYAALHSSLVTFNTACRWFARGALDVWDVRAYGATGDGSRMKRRDQRRRRGRWNRSHVYDRKGTYVHGGFAVVVISCESDMAPGDGSHLSPQARREYAYVVRERRGVTFTGTLDGNQRTTRP